MEDNIDIDLHFDKEPANRLFPTAEFITGKITFTPVKDLEVHILGLRLVLETRGRIDVQRHVLQEEHLIVHETIYKEERYSFPFKLYNERYETYKGYNISFLIKVEPFLRLTKASDNSLLNKIDILALYTPKERKAIGRYLNFKDESSFYKVHESIEKLAYKFSINNLLAFGFLYLLGLLTYIYFGSITLDTFGIFSIGMFLFFGLLEYLCASFIIGDIHGTFNNGENNHLQLQLTNGFNWKQVDKLSVYYEIIEEIIDSRGTSDSKSTKRVLTSKRQFFKSPNRVLEITLPLLKDKPATTQVKDARIYWLLVVE